METSTISPLSEASGAPPSDLSIPREFLPPSRFRCTPAPGLARPRAVRALSSSFSASSSDVSSLPSGCFGPASWSPLVSQGPVSMNAKTLTFNLPTSTCASRAHSEMGEERQDASRKVAFERAKPPRESRSFTCVGFGAADGDHDVDVEPSFGTQRRLGRDISRSQIGTRRKSRLTMGKLDFPRVKRASLPSMLGGGGGADERKDRAPIAEQDRVRPFSGRILLERREAAGEIVSRVLRKIRRDPQAPHA
jgi:hypothetical protein